VARRAGRGAAAGAEAGREVVKMRRSQLRRTNRARVLRSQPISAQDKMWAELRARRLGGLKFVRQAPIDHYFADFLCREQKIVVEVDGGAHGSDAEIVDDAKRTAKIEALGYRMFRVHNIDVYENLDRVLDALSTMCEDAAR
jgi:very-short-patch-repair endonuclease